MISVYELGHRGEVRSIGHGENLCCFNGLTCILNKVLIALSMRKIGEVSGTNCANSEV